VPRAGGLILQRWNDTLKQIMEKLPQLTIDTAEATLDWMLNELISEMPERPPRETAKAQWPGFATDKQRRWYFWALKSGELARQAAATEPLMTGWETEVKATSEGVVGILANTRAYSPWVVGPSYPGVVYAGLNQGRPMYQARIHVGRWFQLGKFMEEHAEELWDALFDDMTEFLDELVTGPLWQ
jgi:hypothetical protein